MPKEISDLAALKCLAHPRRQLVLQQLTLHGPATSATLARALGLNTGATSYHLRELARHGFVSDEPGAAGSGGGGRSAAICAFRGAARRPMRCGSRWTR
ncbi:winged helix-turn-helix domain-containing protein [Streptomyces coryli]|uniref:winged helix-turn-helix domain-containing protein n=1 Tax=Streptomyces coryli TaxID=1128680 RepID=UPI001F0DAF3E|nr:helix-turn-helix domain-containing protein [Streptomyces coryli]